MVPVQGGEGEFVSLHAGAEFLAIITFMLSELIAWIF